MLRTCLGPLLAALLAVFPASGRAEESSRWRIYRPADGLGELFTVAVTVSPRGNIWIKHGGSGQISWLDGFQARSIPSGDSSYFPVYESRSGQLWSLCADGVMEFRRDQWAQYPITEIRVENDSSALRRIHPVPLLPAERDHLLILLPDRLLEYDAGQNRTLALRLARETKLGRFNELVEARDGGAWLSGSSGVAKLPGPIRRLTPESPWQEIVPDPPWQIQNLERPFEDDEGGVTVTADSLLSTNRVILHFNGQVWETPVPTPERVRFAWRGLENRFWAISRNSLLKREQNAWETVKIPGLRDVQYFDVAIEANGVFWLATTEGLVRHSPLTWRAPAELPARQSPVRAILEDRDGGLWFAESDALVLLRDGRAQTFRWPPDFSLTSEAESSLYNLPDGRIVVGTDGESLLFDPPNEKFSTIAHTTERQVKTFIGQFKDGRLCAHTVDKSLPNRFQLEVFDEKQFQMFFESKPDWSLGNEILFLHSSENGAIWLGTGFGLASWDARTKTFTELKGIPGGRAECMIEVARDKIWCASGDVLSEFNGKTWSVVRLGLGHVNAMLKARDGTIWVASNTGLHRFADRSWVSNGVQEGLPNPQVHAVWQDRQGEIWAATGKGISLYHRSADVDPPVSVISAADNPKEVSSSDMVRLVFRGRDKWDETPPDRLLFTHRLDEGSWSPFSSEASTTFTNPPVGKHRFAIRAMDRNWNEESEPEVYEFVSMMPWFMDPRLLSLAVFGAIITAFLAWLAVNRHLRLLRGYAEVEQIVAQRTRELERANQELLHSQKMRALGTLAAGIAHDFNNILSIIKGSAQIIEANPADSEKIKTRVDRIKTMVDQGSGIVKAMLGFSRAGQEERLCDLNQLVSETKKLLDDQFSREVELQLELAPVLPQVKVISELIQQMLLNLVLNSADAMSGQGQIVLRTGCLDRLPQSLVLHPAAALQYVYISVADTGCGIASEIMPRIFEPFFTTKAFSSRRGTGLGLSMVYEIAKEMGFGLMAESVQGKGSAFTILLPAEAMLSSTESRT